MYLLYSFIIGIICITLIDVVGSITSKKYAYPYVYLTPISFAAYVFIGYLASKGSQLSLTLLVPVAVGIYDATIGWDIWMKLGSERERELAKDNPLANRLAAMIFFGLIFGFVGHLIAR